MTDEEYRQQLYEGFLKVVFIVSTEGLNKKILHVRSGPLMDAAARVAGVFASTDADLRNPAIMKKIEKQFGGWFANSVRMTWAAGGLQSVFKKMVSYTDPDEGNRQ